MGKAATALKAPFAFDELVSSATLQGLYIGGGVDHSVRLASIASARFAPADRGWGDRATSDRGDQAVLSVPGGT
jgi:hypothetical protein